MSLKVEVLRWVDFSKRLDRLYGVKTSDSTFDPCPFCGKSNVRIETLSSGNGADKNLRIAFFTCPRCNESWSDLIQ